MTRRALNACGLCRRNRRSIIFGLMAEESTEPAESKPAESGRRRPYKTPVLRVFGTVAAMTEAQSNASSHAADGGPVGHAKT